MIELANKNLPNIVKGGVLVGGANPQPEVRRNAESAHDWTYHEEAVVLYNLAVRFRDELIDPLERVDRSRMGDPVISFADERNKEVLATYRVGRNDFGLRDEINFNNVHYRVDEQGKPEWMYGRWSQLETLLHEQIHLYMHHLTEVDGKKRPAHGKEFTKKCESLGLHPVPNVGSHYQVADIDSPFGRIMKELGIPRPADVPRGEGDPLPKRDYWRPEKGKGRSSLAKYECECNPPQRARIGKADFFAVCTICDMPFTRRS